MAMKNAAVEAIKYSLSIDDCYDAVLFLRWWCEGSFDRIRTEFPDAPESVYIGADPLHPKTFEQN